MADNLSFGPKGNVWAVIKELYTMLSNALSVITTKGAVPVIISRSMSALTGDMNLTTTYKIRVIDAWVVPTAASAGATVTVKNGANAITNAMVAAVDTTVARAATIDDAQTDIDAGGTLRFTGANAASAIVYVLALRIT